jgi:DNA helicase-2/ATP-dependent DNA helicase PcrA
MVAAAGAGKTTFLVREALKIKNEKVLILTYTEANEAEIKRKLLKENAGQTSIPSNITIQKWFSFLLQHGVKPYQGSCNQILFDKRINGMEFVAERSGFRYSSLNKITRKPFNVYWGEDDFDKFYFNKGFKIFSDKLSKFVCRCNEKSNGELLQRLSNIYSYILIDEVQDLAGYDLDILKLLFKSPINVLLVGDPRQVTYLTHHEAQYSTYKDGRIKEFLLDNCKKLQVDIDETTLKYSHRNNKEICNFSSKLYPNLAKSEPCSCANCRSEVSEHKGIYLVRKDDVEDYKKEFLPTVLKYRDSAFPEWNFGKSKGLDFMRVLIVPTDTIVKYLLDGALTKVVKGKSKPAFDIAKFYVALTRAKYSVGVIYDYDDDEVFIEGVQKWPNQEEKKKPISREESLTLLEA